MSTSQKSSQKRMLLVLGGKGGVGKTLFCRLLFFYFNQAKANFAAFDADRENPELHTLHANCEPAVQLFNFLDVNQAKLFLGYLEESQPETVFLDMPAASSHGVREQFQRFDLLNMAMDPSLGYRITVVGVLNHSYHAIGSLSEMMEAFGERADYVAVLSEMWTADGHDFELWYDSKERELFEKLKGVEVKMPLLELSSLHALHRQNLPFARAGELTIGDRVIIRSFLNRTRALFDPAAAYLALPPLEGWKPVSFNQAASKPTAAKSKTSKAKSTRAKSAASSSRTPKASSEPTPAEAGGAS